MKRLLFPFLCLLFFVLVGCTTRYKSEDVATPAVASLERGQSVYIAMPDDGAYGDKVYDGSGLKTAKALQVALRPYTSKIYIAPNTALNIDEVIAGAKAQGARYAFIPDISNWVHRRAALSGRSSGVTLNMTVYDVQENKQLIMKELRVQGRNLSFTSQHPEKILQPLLVQFANDIF